MFRFARSLAQQLISVRFQSLTFMYLKFIFMRISRFHVHSSLSYLLASHLVASHLQLAIPVFLLLPMHGFLPSCPKLAVLIKASLQFMTYHLTQSNFQRLHQ
jgi:hypothetical protein